MGSKRQIFLVYGCNEWKNKPMPLLMATTSPMKVKMFVSKLIEDGDADYDFGHGTDFSPRRMAKEFRKDFRWMTRDSLNSRLWNVYFDYVMDGEEL